MTPALLATLKTWDTANASGLSKQASADLANTLASPDFWVWRSFVSAAEIYGQAGDGGTSWDWAAYIALTAVTQNAWQAMMQIGLVPGMNASLTNIRTGVAAIWPAGNNRTHLLAIGRRKATAFEKAAATGTGSTASPAVMGFEGTVTANDVAEARG